MQGRALTPDVILSGNLSVSKTVNLQNKVIYDNGQYEADEGYDGLGKVTVDVHNPMTDLKVTENGLYFPPEGYDGFDQVDVDVPDPELDYIYITQNGRYTPPAGKVGYDDIQVNVNLNLESKTITSNGHYEPSQGKNGFSDVTVNVPERVPVIESKSITENGTYTAPTGVDGYSPITVNVPLPANAYLKKSVSGLPLPIASFSDGADAVMQSLKVDITPVQSGSGDPSPENVRPISGFTEGNVSVSGVNQWDEEWVVGTISTITGEYSASGDRVCSKNYIRVEPNKTYYKQNFAWQFYYDKNKSFINAISLADGTFTIPNNVYYMKFYTASTYGQTYNNDISINYPSTDTEYHAYNGHTTTISWEDEAGTVYGGTLDVVSGVLTVTHAIRHLKDIASWNRISSGTKAFYQTRGTALPNIVYPFTSAVMYPISSAYSYSASGTQAEGTFRVSDALYIVDNRFENNADFVNFLTTNDVTVKYQLATPTTYQLSPTAVASLLGDNNVWADTGDVTECEYLSKTI